MKSNVEIYSNKYRNFILIMFFLLFLVGVLLRYSIIQVLGDYGFLWFQAIVILNTLSLLRDINKAKFKLRLFYMKVVCFPFLLYLTVIFIPYMPYILITPIWPGIGPLNLVPLIILVVHIKQLYRDYFILKPNYRKHIIGIVAAIGFLTLPALLAADFYSDRMNFSNAMVYIDPNQNEQPKIDINRLSRSITHMRCNPRMDVSFCNCRQRNRRSSFEFWTPFSVHAFRFPIISNIYNHIVFDEMVITNDEMAKLGGIFYTRDYQFALYARWHTLGRRSSPEEHIARRDAEALRRFDTKITVSEIECVDQTGVYKAWVNFEITQLHDIQLEEYRIIFTLPAGTFITDYYLYVFDEKKEGIITDRWAALTLYEEIVETPDDPGIIYYINDNTIALRVYPFSGGETRRTGFQIMYSQNETLNIKGQNVYLVAENPISEPLVMDGVTFIPAEYKKSLPYLERKPQYYFLLDAGNPDLYLKYFERARQFADERNISPIYYAVSYQVKEVIDLYAATAPVHAAGGFNIAHAMNKILTSVPDGYFPVILLVADDMTRAIPIEGHELATAFPESEYYYRLNDSFSLRPFRFYNSVRLQAVEYPILNKSLNYNGTAISAENSEVIITGLDFTDYTGNEYIDAFILQKNTFFAYTEEQNIALTKDAMSQRVLTRNTAFIVLETREQEDQLYALQAMALRSQEIWYGGEGGLPQTGGGVSTTFFLLFLLSIAWICTYSTLIYKFRKRLFSKGGPYVTLK